MFSSNNTIPIIDDPHTGEMPHNGDKFLGWFTRQNNWENVVHSKLGRQDSILYWEHVW